ncbi:MAG TPA: glucose-1-phosphate adenylyltransferase [bacterium]|nr:glucose-1-phosphate adenylyltransferase [Candidatus Omnitrophota bacterium]HOJ60725.1 glucose-1-phosphate adenylyltransferase [bacterium]HOL95122.1 glucose-1-phosphate adenylyltransferase [bacterium]HPP02265.1 glucose-1-phosphate adenylyltransferase [bacterium]
MDRLAPSLLRNTLTLILAGGQGERLYPLTKDRSKPSVPFAGSYRIIDFTLSNCINSGLRQIYVLTQYKSQSLYRHIRDGWNLLSRELGEYIETVPPQKRMHSRWYEGTADAIYQNIFLLEQWKPERTLILSGDHIYRMDYHDLLAYHVDKKADATIACYEYPREKATEFGVMQVDADHRVIQFVEKPADPPAIPGRPDRALVNMGIYVFNTACMVRSVIEDHKDLRSQHDLGKNIFPRLVQKGGVALYAYPFSRQGADPYWRDVGHLMSYYQANMDLLNENQSFNLFSSEWPFRSSSFQLPPCRLNLSNSQQGRIARSFVSGGCRIEGNLDRCVISPLVEIGEGSELVGCVVFNGTVIGRHCRIRNTIIDKNVRIPDGCVIGYDAEQDQRQFMRTEEGIVVIPKEMQVEKTD